MDVAAARRSVAWLSLGVLLLSLGINTLSAWIRHTEAGLACADRLACYGLVGPLVESAAAAARAAGAAGAALEPEADAKRLHRALATALVVAVLVLVHRARTPGVLGPRDARLPYLMAGLLLVLAVIGPASYLKTVPAIATANLLGGVLLAACAWRLWLGTTAGVPLAADPPRRGLLNLAVGVLLAQIALGAWQSANFAGMACAGGRDCLPSFDPAALASAAWYLRELPLDATGRVPVEPATVLIHLAHRGGAVLVFAALVAVAGTTLRAGRQQRGDALALLALLLAQLALGVGALARDLPLALVLAHNVLATLLLLVLLRLRHRLPPARGTA